LAHEQVVDEKLLQFKKEQRDNRNKAKLEYIIGAALEGPQALDETLLDLCETRGLDDGLVDYLDEIVEKARNADLSADPAQTAVCALAREACKRRSSRRPRKRELARGGL